MNKHRKGIRITNGRAVSIGKDLYYMQGPSHELGGIDVGNNLEVEGGEVMQVNKDNIKVFSAQPILNGISPAEKILGGGSPNKVFDEQERYKDRNKLNDDGSVKSSSTGGRDRAKQRNKTITKDLNIMNEQYKCGGKSKKGLLGIEVPPIYDFQRRIYSDPRFKDYTRRGYYSEGIGKGGGAGTTFNTDSEKVNKVVNDTIYIPLVEDFNTAFGRARQQGDSTFVFNDKLYNTKVGNNPKNVEAGAARLQNIGVLPVVREKEYEEIIPAKTYKTKKELGGLNRSKDYGSKDKPYPKVKSSDFAGGGRSYPIPTKADAIDALRLAGLHSRSDVRAKVYKKYPELKKRNGGVVTINGNVIDKLISTPRKAKLGTEDKKYKTYIDYDLATGDELDYRKDSTYNDNWRISPPYEPISDKNINTKPIKLIKNDNFNTKANPSNLKQEVIPYKPVPFLWDDEQYNVSGRSFNKTNSRNINNNTNGYDPIEELLLQIKELGTDAQGKSIPEGITFAADRTQPNIANFTFGNEKSDKLRERTGFEQSNVYGIPVSTNVTELTPRKGYDTFSPIIESPAKTEKQNTTKAKTTKTYNNRNISKSSYPRLTRFLSITRAGITIPKTDINNIRLNNFVSQEDANAGFRKEQDKVDDKVKKSRKRNLINDIVGAGTNIIGSGLSYANTRRALTNMQAPTEPIYEQAQKLITDYNINPQLSDIEEQTKQMADVISANTSTGRARIQRLQRAMNVGLNAKNKLRGQKENIETQLKNADIMNRQSVNARNVAARNAWQNNVINFQNNIREQLASNRNRLYSGINASIQDMLTRRENRRQYNNTLGIYAATHPNVNRKIFEQYGVEF